VTRIVAPAVAVESGAVVVPACTLYNYGHFTESYWVRMRIGTLYDTTASVTGHAAGTKLGLEFPQWVANCSLGFYPVVCSTRLSGDMTPQNDARRDSFEVQPGTGLAGGLAGPHGLRLEVVPNPAAGRAVVFYSAGGAGPVAVRLYDAAGRLALTLAEAERGGRVVRLDTRRLAPGVYWLKLTAGQTVLTRKLVVSR